MIFKQVVLADPPGERRHDRLVAGHDLRVGQQDRVADVAVVGDDERGRLALTSHDRHRPAVDALEPRRLDRRRVAVAARAVVLDEQLATLPRPSTARPAAPRPASARSPTAPSPRPSRSSSNAPSRNTRRRTGDTAPASSPGTRAKCIGPGSTSCLIRKSGTKKLWITSSEIIRSTTARPTGTCSSLISRLPSGCWSFHIHCLPTTSIRNASFGGANRSKKTTAPPTNIPIAIVSGMPIQSASISGAVTSADWSDRPATRGGSGRRRRGSGSR